MVWVAPGVEPKQVPEQLVDEFCQVGTPPETIKIWPAVPIGKALKVSVFEEYKISPVE